MANELRDCCVDTCFTDKSNDSELSETIIPIYCWHQEAIESYVYRVDDLPHERHPITMKSRKHHSLQEVDTNR